MNVRTTTAVALSKCIHKCRNVFQQIFVLLVLYIRKRGQFLLSFAQRQEMNATYWLLVQSNKKETECMHILTEFKYTLPPNVFMFRIMPQYTKLIVNQMHGKQKVIKRKYELPNSEIHPSLDCSLNGGGFKSFSTFGGHSRLLTAQIFRMICATSAVRPLL